MATTAIKTLVVKVHFKTNEMIPPQYNCNGLNINPELTIEELPANTKVSLLV
jgi:phosphatidylethanolamine-binding protein (PEBP) family uncharacterized protein